MRYFLLFCKKTMRYTLKPLSFLPAIFMMYIIFSLSAQNGMTSSQLSSKVSQKLVAVADELLQKDWTKEQQVSYAAKIHYQVRKAGHVTEYFLLAISVSFPLYVYGIRGFWLILLAGTICVGFAGLDEYHQSFVAGRGPSKRDVLIDCIGIFPGIIIVRIFGFLGRKTIFAPLSMPQKDKH